MSILIFILILGVLVFVHELGHFLVAKAFSIRVDEFALGFPPRIFSRKHGETEYSLNLVPFGGYVKIYGEDMTALPPSGPDREHSFVSKNRAIQAAVLVAGVTSNVIFAWFLLSSIFMIGANVSSEQYKGIHLKDERLMIVDVMKNSPAEGAGVKAGDVIRFVRVGEEEVGSSSIEAVQQFISVREGKNVVLGVDRKSKRLEILAVPERGIVGERAGIGISMDTVGTLKLSFLPALYEGGKRTLDILMLTGEGIGQFLYSIFLFKADFSSVAGPVGIAVYVSEAGELGWFYLASFSAIISLNLAVINLIPFPALDGGRLLFVLIESITRRPLPQKLVYRLNAAGFMLLLGLIFFITYKDILKLL